MADGTRCKISRLAKQLFEKAASLPDDGDAPAAAPLAPDDVVSFKYKGKVHRLTSEELAQQSPCVHDYVEECVRLGDVRVDGRCHPLLVGCFDDMLHDARKHLPEFARLEKAAMQAVAKFFGIRARPAALLKDALGSSPLTLNQYVRTALTLEMLKATNGMDSELEATGVSKWAASALLYSVVYVQSVRKRTT